MMLLTFEDSIMPLSRQLILVLLGLSLSASAATAEPVNGLYTEIFRGESLKDLVTTRIDPNIDWYWGDIRPDRDAPADHFSIRWSGWIQAPLEGRYKLTLMGDDGFRLFLDGKPLIDEWREGGHVTHSVSVDLTGRPQKIAIEYHDIDKAAWITFWWQPVGSPTPSIVPSNALFPDEESANDKSKKKRLPPHGLVADYFDLKTRRHTAQGLVHRTEAIWGDWTAEPGTALDGAARYTGFLVPIQSGSYKLTAFADDRLRVWIDEKPVLEAKFDEGISTAYVELQADTAHAIRLEYRDMGKWGSYYVHWVPPQASEETFIPCDLLYPTKQSLPKGIQFATK